MRGFREGKGGPYPPEKSHKYRVSLQYWSESPEKSQSYQTSIQCWTIIGLRAKHHLSLSGRRCPAYRLLGSSFPLIKRKKKTRHSLTPSEKMSGSAQERDATKAYSRFNADLDALEDIPMGINCSLILHLLQICLCFAMRETSCRYLFLTIIKLVLLNHLTQP